MAPSTTKLNHELIGIKVRRRLTATTTRPVSRQTSHWNHTHTRTDPDLHNPRCGEAAEKLNHRNTPVRPAPQPPGVSRRALGALLN
ncbi:MAG: hypothetical protein ACRDOX_10075, partial [Nocardioides sp.]